MKSKDPQPTMPSAGAFLSNGTSNGPLPQAAVLPPPLPPALSSPPSLETVWHIIRRRWLTICCLGLLAAGLGFAAVWLLFPGKYTATRNLRIGKANRGAYESEEAFSSFVRAQASLIKSNDVIRRLLDQASIQELHEVQSKGDARQWLQDKIVTDTQPSSEILRISLTGDNPEELAAILDELIRQYLKESKTREDVRARERSEQLLANYQKTAEALREKRIVLANKLQEAGIEDPQTITIKQNSLYQSILALEAERVKLKREQSADSFNLAALKQTLDKPESIVISQSAIDEKMEDEPLLKPLYDELVAIDKKIAETARVAPTSPLLAQYKQERDEAVKRLRANIDQHGAAVQEKLRRRAADDLGDNIAKLQAKLKSDDRQTEILDAEIATRQLEMGKLKTASQANDRSTHGVSVLVDDVSQMEMVLKRIGEELGALQIDNSTGPRVELLDKKSVPAVRKTDAQLSYASAGGLLMFGLVFFGVVFWEHGHRRVYTPDDVTGGLNLPLLGTLPRVAGAARPGGTAANPAQDAREHNALIESIDAIRTSLLHLARSEQIHVVMVTSPGFGEGKTTLACHLAASLARGSRTTLLIDCGLRNPAAYRQFDLPNEPGLSEALRGEVEFEEAIQSTPVARLSLLPAGKTDRLAIQCLAQADVEKAFHRLREQYDFIIIDVSPVLPVADALLVGQYADAAIFSVLRTVSRLPALHAAWQKLSALGVRMLGAVVIGDRTEVGDHPQSLRN